MPLSENPNTTPILDSLLPTLEQFTPESAYRPDAVSAASRRIEQKLINDWLTRQEIEEELNKLPNEYERKYFLLDMKVGSRGFFMRALDR